MKKMSTTALTGLAIGATIGTAAYMMNTRSGKAQYRKIKKGAKKAMKVVSSAVDNIYTMVK